MAETPLRTEPFCVVTEVLLSFLQPMGELLKTGMPEVLYQNDVLSIHHRHPA